MYQVYIGDLSGNNSILYHPADPNYAIYDTTLSLQVGSAGTFEFTIPTNNPKYSEIKQGSIITITLNGEEYWRGEVKETTKDFYGSVEVYCVEDLSWLSLEYMMPTQILTESYAQRFQAAINAYNATQIGAERTFEIGYITNVGASAICNWSTKYEWSILDSLRECICKDTGYIKIRRQNGKRYVDIVSLADYGVLATQPIRFAQNLLDYAEEMNMDNFTNVLYPYGKETDVELYEGTNQRLAGTVISDEDSISKYGRHAKTVCFETDDINTLNNLAQAYLSRYSQPQLRFELDAIDLSDISNEVRINIGDSVRVIAAPFGIDQRVYLIEQKINLQDGSKSTFTLSSYMHKGRTLTEQTIGTMEAVEDIPSKASFLDAAKKNALNLLEGVDGGYVTYKFNPDGQPIEIRITDNIDEEQSLKKWVWNQNGLGFMTRDNTTEDFQPSGVSVALTMDGQILAKTGVIGSDNEAWNIGEHSIFNGTTSISDTTNDGLYIGTDGIINVATGTLGYKVYTKIKSGQIESTSRIRASSMSAGTLSVDAGKSINCSIKGYVNGEERYIGFNFVDGILTGVS